MSTAAYLSIAIATIFLLILVLILGQLERGNCDVEHEAVVSPTGALSDSPSDIDKSPKVDLLPPLDVSSIFQQNVSCIEDQCVQNGTCLCHIGASTP